MPYRILLTIGFLLVCAAVGKLVVEWQVTGVQPQSRRQEVVISAPSPGLSPTSASMPSPMITPIATAMPSEVDDLPRQYPGIHWRPTKSVVLGYDITSNSIGTVLVMPTLMPDGMEYLDAVESDSELFTSKSTLTESQLEGLYRKFMTYYDTELSDRGWKPFPGATASGPAGETFGYSKAHRYFLIGFINTYYLPHPSNAQSGTYFYVIHN